MSPKSLRIDDASDLQDFLHFFFDLRRIDRHAESVAVYDSLHELLSLTGQQ